MPEDKQDIVLQEIVRIGREEVRFGSYKVTIRTHQGKITGMSEKHQDRETTIN
jgi:hypothetical protein